MPANPVTFASLTDVIKALKDTITRDGNVIMSNETRTRDVLINPLIRALGWDNPSIITHEYIVTFRRFPFRNSRVDYALHQPDKRSELIAFIEAKRASENLTPDHHKQLFKYAKDRQVRRCVLTNGDYWHIFEAISGNWNRTARFSIRKHSASACARKLLNYFPKPPGFETTSPATPSVMPTLDPSIYPTVIDIILSRTPATSIDLRKVFAYLTFSFVASIILGWVTGIALAPTSSLLLATKLVAFLGLGPMALLVSAAIVHLLFQHPKSKDTDFWRLIPLLEPINGNKPMTRYWITVATIGGIGVGGIPGYILSDALMGFLEDRGVLFMAIFPIVLLGIVVLLPSMITRLFRKTK